MEHDTGKAAEDADGKKAHHILVNGKSHKVKGSTISYDEVIVYGFPEGPFDVAYKVTFTDPNGNEGPLTKGGETMIHEDMEFRVHKAGLHPIVVNGKPREVKGSTISYDEVVTLAYPEGPFDITYTVVYTNPHGHDGTLVKDQETKIHDGMEFRVRKTGRS